MSLAADDELITDLDPAIRDDPIFKGMDTVEQLFVICLAERLEEQVVRAQRDGLEEALETHRLASERLARTEELHALETRLRKAEIEAAEGLRWRHTLRLEQIKRRLEREARQHARSRDRVGRAYCALLVTEILRIEMGYWPRRSEVVSALAQLLRTCERPAAELVELARDLGLLEGRLGSTGGRLHPYEPHDMECWSSHSLEEARLTMTIEIERRRAQKGAQKEA